MAPRDTFALRQLKAHTPINGANHFSLQALFQVNFSATDMASLDLKPGDFCTIRPVAAAGADPADDDAAGTGRPGQMMLAVARRSTDPDMNGAVRVAKVTDGAMALFGVGGKVRAHVARLPGPAAEPYRASRVLLRPVDGSGGPVRGLPPGHAWEFLARFALFDGCTFVCKNTYFPVVIREGPDRGLRVNFVVEEVTGPEGADGPLMLARTAQGGGLFWFTPTTTVAFVGGAGAGAGVAEPVSRSGAMTPVRVAGENRLSSSPSPFVSAAVRPPELRTPVRAGTYESVPGTPMGGQSGPRPEGPEGARARTTFADVAGLESEIEKIYAHFRIRPRPGAAELRATGRSLLVYGPQGTGKTLVADAIASLDHWAGVWRLGEVSGTSRAVAAMRAVFEAAAAGAGVGVGVEGPRLVVLGRVDVGGGTRESRTGETAAVGQALSGLLKEYSRLGVSAVGLATELEEVPEQLRKSFARELELPIPNTRAREKICRVLLRRAFAGQTAEEAGVEEVAAAEKMAKMLAERTHGYVGRDLEAVVDEAAVACSCRVGGTDRPRVGQLSEGDVLGALGAVQPSALRHVIVETPNVRWEDIGGCGRVKRLLVDATTARLRYPEMEGHFRVPPARGILMYGPPGCSKTLTAKAAATESGYNFLAVRGAELTSMYVGETERAVREVFRKARAAQPAIIFFDEIDAIAGNRFGRGGGGDSGGGSGGGGKGGGAHPGLAVVTTLLNEMDGIDSRGEVIVLAATNRPEALDDALLRPGRFSALVHLGLPDGPGRREIVRVGMRGVPVGAGVDPDGLADRLGGYTAAEVVEVVAQACRAAAAEWRAEVEEWELRRGLAGVAIGPAGEVEGQVEGQEERPAPGMVEWRHFEAALETVQPGVDAETEARYQSWRRSVRV